MQLAGNDRIRLVIWCQFGVTLAIALLLALFAARLAWSGLSGGLIASLTSALAAERVFRPYRAQEPGRVLRRMVGAELGRFLVTMALFALAFASIDRVSPLALLGSYLLVQGLVPMLALFFADRLKTGKGN